MFLLLGFLCSMNRLYLEPTGSGTCPTVHQDKISSISFSTEKMKNCRPSAQQQRDLLTREHVTLYLMRWEFLSVAQSDAFDCVPPHYVPLQEKLSSYPDARLGRFRFFFVFVHRELHIHKRSHITHHFENSKVTSTSRTSIPVHTLIFSPTVFSSHMFFIFYSTLLLSTRAPYYVSLLELHHLLG